MQKVDICALQRQHGFCESIIRVLGSPTDGEHFWYEVLLYFLKDRLLYRKVESDGQMRLILLIPKILLPNVLEEDHDSLCEGHLRISRTYEKIRRRYFWPKCLNVVFAYCASCVSCQGEKNPVRKSKGYLQPLPIKGPLQRVHIDFAGPFQISKRRNMV